MLNGASVDVPQSSRMGSPVQTDAPLPKEAGTYLNAGSLPENDDCRFHGGAQRSVSAAQASNLLATVDVPVKTVRAILCCVWRRRTAT